MKKGNLLLVDDEPLILKRLKFNLEELADEIYTAENGIEALEILRDHSIDCVVCDINMPKMDGVEVIKKVRLDKNEVPFIFYTGHGNQELMMEAVKYGAFDFLDKPNLEGLEDVVSRGLSQGVGDNTKSVKSADIYISDYQKLLDDI